MDDDVQHFRSMVGRALARLIEQQEAMARAVDREGERRRRRARLRAIEEVARRRWLADTDRAMEFRERQRAHWRARVPDAETIIEIEKMASR